MTVEVDPDDRPVRYRPRVAPRGPGIVRPAVRTYRPRVNAIYVGFLLLLIVVIAIIRIYG